MLLSVFCGAGGLDLGFELAGFTIGAAFDRNRDSVRSYNQNRSAPNHAFVEDVVTLTLKTLDERFGKKFEPTGVIGGPPCQSFSQANVNQQDDDPRHAMPVVYAKLIGQLHKRKALDFFVLENVVGLTLNRHKKTLKDTIAEFESSGFEVTPKILNARDYETPQSRERLFLVGFNKEKYGSLKWDAPQPRLGPPSTVRSAIFGLPPATHFERGLKPDKFPHHPNHWCMAPKSPKFKKEGALTEGYVRSRSFKTLSWDRPSIAVAYGHREVHIHPDGKRRLSVYEAMMLQGFPHQYRLLGTLSSQITQVSEAVPPPLAFHIAQSIRDQLRLVSDSEKPSRQLANKVLNLHRPKRQVGEPLSPRGKVVVR